VNVPKMRFPVVCPACGREMLAEYPVATLAAALLNHGPIVLHSNCHDVSWAATEIEVEQIREYLGAPWLESGRAEPSPQDRGR
jgi:DNA-binding IclR family transcriptional regulator